MAGIDLGGAYIHYEVLGAQGPWVTLMPGGRRAMDGVRGLASRIAAAGYRVLIHDRRNCGASDVVLDDSAGESEIWAEDLHRLLLHVGAAQVWVGGGSSGCRTSLIYQRRHPGNVIGLLLWRVTGGAFAAKRLAEQYYGQYVRAAQAGGMAAVCETEHFRERIAARPANREVLTRLDVPRFVEIMQHWSGYFERDASLPVIGAGEAELRAIGSPTCIVPGNDNTHPAAVGEAMHALVPGSELHSLFPQHEDVDVVPPEDWAVKEAKMAGIFVDFMRRHSSAA